MNTMQNVSPKNSLPLPKNRQKTEWFHSVLTSMTMLTQSQNLYVTDLTNVETVRFLTLS